MNDVTCVTPGCDWMKLLDVVGERFGLADVRAGRQEDVDHELRPRRGREEALLDLAEAVERRDERDDRQHHHRPAEAERQRRAGCGTRGTSRPPYGSLLPAAPPAIGLKNR